MTKVSLLALFSASVLSAACGPTERDEGIGGGGDGSGSGSSTGSDTGTASQCDKIDIVFVVDNSGSMEEEQTNLAQNFPMFAQQIEAQTTPDGLPIDYRVALTTTGRTIDYTVTLPGFGSIPEHEEGENGAFQTECGSQMRWLEKGDPNMATELACRANVGTTGPGIEMPLLMSKWSLTDRVQDGTNVGFLRPDALLAIVVLTDEDDSSTTQNNFTMDATGTTPLDFNPADEVTFLDNLKGNRSRWAAGVIAGDGDCTSNFGQAADGTRLKEFVNLANQGGYNQATFSSICAGDLTTGLKQALDLFQSACGQIIL